MVEGLIATQPLQGGNSEREVTSEEHQAPVEDTSEPDAAGDQRVQRQQSPRPQLSRARMGDALNASTSEAKAAAS